MEIYRRIRSVIRESESATHQVAGSVDEAIEMTYRRGNGPIEIYIRDDEHSQDFSTEESHELEPEEGSTAYPDY